MLVKWFHNGPDTGRQAVIVLRRAENENILRVDALIGDAPFAGNLAGRVGGFGAGAHGSDLVVAEARAEFLGDQRPFGRVS